MQLLEVNDNQKLKNEFLMLPVKLYAQDQNWIRPWDHDVEAVFDPAKNKHFAHGECIRWILQDADGQTIGRVAAFIDLDKQEEQPTGGMGFFECIDDQNAAFVLFEACKNWLISKGMEAMDGPINFGDRDAWWGLMTKGWNHEPTYRMPWTKEYYIGFFDAFGFKDYFQQFVYQASVTHPPVVPSVEDKANRIFKSSDYVFKHIEKKHIDRYAEDFRVIYNEAWASFPGVKAMTSEQALSLVATMKPIIDEELIWFGYTAAGRPVAFFVTIPDINQIVKHLDGQFDTWAKIKMGLHLLRGTIKRTCGLIFGIVPDFQGRGMESAIALRMRNAGRENPYFQYDSIDFNWVGDFNPKMMRFSTQLGAKIEKTFITYRYLFDREKPFKRCPRVG